MAKQTSTAMIFVELEKNRQVSIERKTFNMGKRREVFYLEIKNKKFPSLHSYKFPNLTLKELEKILESVKLLKTWMEEEN